MLANQHRRVRHGGRVGTATDLLGVGIYSLPQASRLTGIERGTLRRWMRGYYFTKSGAVAKKHSLRVIEGELPEIDHALALSFLDLQEARCLQEFRKRKIGWKRLRELHEIAKNELGNRHPFSTGQFKTVGCRVMRDFADEHGDQILLDIFRNQTTFRDFLVPYLEGLKFVDGRPVLWYPLRNSKRVVIDPRRSFGHPIVSRRGVPTSILAKAYKAERSYQRVSRWYEVDLSSVRDAVAYEHGLRTLGLRAAGH